MKRTLSLILAALLLASSAVSCGKTEPAETAISETDIGVTETKAPETQSPETSISETNAPETSSPAPDYAYDTTLITENGIAKSHIVLPDGASDFEKTAADELAYHIKLVSGADVAVTNAVQADSLPIIIATPDSLPELETLFPEDLAWLRVLSEKNAENGRTLHWGDDGFAIRLHDGKIYIFGATALGTMNGVYDFIEENLDLIWINGNETGIIFDNMPTVTTIKTDYREKSPFYIANTTNGDYHSKLYCIRNKLSLSDSHPYGYPGGGADANVKEHIYMSPLYDPSITEYWDSMLTGTHFTVDESGQINFWSDLAVDTVAACVISVLDSFSDADRPKLYTLALEDVAPAHVYPEMTLPFEYAPGQFIEPSESGYLSTVYFTFINRVAKQVAEKYPDVYINALAYMWAQDSPRCEIEDNVIVWFCTYDEDVTQESFSVRLTETDSGDATQEAKALHNWLTAHPDTVLHIYSYYHCHYVLGWYERPVWYRIADDFRYFAENGIIGITSCGAPSEDDAGTIAANAGVVNWQSSSYVEKFTIKEGWDMNLLSSWLYHKLLWNPYEDVDALIEKFCDKVYGDASSYMQEYYDLLETSWSYGAELIPLEFNAEIKLHLDQEYYNNFFLDFELDDGTHFLDAVKDVLTKAYETADEKAKEFIRWPYEVYQDWGRFLVPIQ